jgi:hypothetical protein
MFLEVAERDLIDYLIFVYDKVRFCFPDYYHIFELNCSICHQRIYEIYSSWGKIESLKSNEILAMTMWYVIYVNCFLFVQILG